MQQCADVTVNVSAFPAVTSFEKLIGFKFRIQNTDYPDCVYEIVSAAEQWDIRWGWQYNLHCKVIQDISGSREAPAKTDRH